MQQNRDHAQQNSNKKRGEIRMWQVLCVVLLVAVVALSVTWAAVHAKQKAQAQTYRNKLEDGYRLTYSEFVYSLGNLADNLNKVQVAASPSLQMQLLGQANTYAVQAATSLSGVGQVQALQKAMRCINQTGDYCLRLQYSLAQGGTIGEAERDNLAALYQSVCQIERTMRTYADRVDEDGYSFVEALSDAEGIEALFARFDAEAVAYPSLIYDGPFSDALAMRTPKLVGPELTAAQAQERVPVYLPYEGTVTLDGESQGDIPSYRFSVQTSYGTYWVEIAKKGGYLLSLNSAADPTDTVYGQEEIVQYGTYYLSGIGLDNMQAVWVSNYNSVYYVNYAYAQDDVICYSDLIILKIDAETKRLVGVEALNYVYNHVERTLSDPAVDAEQASQTVRGIQPDSVRLALVPTAGGNEKLCYEVHGTHGEDQYFVYVDAETGEEYKIMRVIDSASGTLII